MKVEFKYEGENLNLSALLACRTEQFCSVLKKWILTLDLKTNRLLKILALAIIMDDDVNSLYLVSDNPDLYAQSQNLVWAVKFDDVTDVYGAAVALARDQIVNFLKKKNDSTVKDKVASLFTKYQTEA